MINKYKVPLMRNAFLDEDFVTSTLLEKNSLPFSLMAENLD